MIDVDVRDLMAHPGSSRRHVFDRPVPGLRLELGGVPEDAPIRGELLLEGVVEGILVSGPLTGRVTLSCARCLKEFPGRVELTVRELFVRGPDSDADDYPISEEGSLDLEPMVRDGVLLSLPFSPLCRPDCPGLCERCGGDRNLGECSCAPEDADPRWAPLEGLFDDRASTV